MTTGLVVIPGLYTVEVQADTDIPSGVDGGMIVTGSWSSQSGCITVVHVSLDWSQ